jgi:hypothetical protein
VTSYAQFGPNTTWGEIIGRSRNKPRRCSNGAGDYHERNLHLDPASGVYATYLNYYNGTGGVYFGSIWL